MNVLITGTSTGIGEATADLFLNNGHVVAGLDIDCTFRENWLNTNRYTHIVCDVSNEKELPELPFVPQIIINNAGVQDAAKDIAVNLQGTINICEKYINKDCIRAIVNVASTSAHNGAEFPTYAASKGGMLAYTKHLAMRVAEFGATCNSISPGGVYTNMNKHIIDNPDMMKQCLEETLLHRWASAEEIDR